MGVGFRQLATGYGEVQGGEVSLAMKDVGNGLRGWSDMEMGGWRSG